ncbi:MAG TPA: hypothetical protein VGN78_04195 [Solirubrobacteraceae bacterium]|jgi:hypothetical protein|nr:hypothetical protein [Solirubrobacteraceae bacterium]
MFATSLRFYDIVLFIHIAAVVTAFGVTFVYPLIVPLTQRSAPDKLPWLHRLQGEIGRKIISPSAGLVLLAGLYLALSGDGPFDLKDWWVGFGLLAILVLLGLGGAFFAPRERRLAELAERDLAGGGKLSEEYEGLAVQVARVGALSSLLVLVTVLFMVLGARGVFT